MAALASVMRAIRYDMLTERRGIERQYVADARRMEQIKDELERYDLSPQDWDDLYDLMHRGGANA